MIGYRAQVEAGDVVIVPRNAVPTARRTGWCWGAGNTLALVGVVAIVWWATR